MNGIVLSWDTLIYLNGKAALRCLIRWIFFPWYSWNFASIIQRSVFTAFPFVLLYNKRIYITKYTAPDKHIYTCRLQTRILNYNNIYERVHQCHGQAGIPEFVGPMWVAGVVLFRQVSLINERLYINKCQDYAGSIRQLSRCGSSRKKKKRQDKRQSVFLKQQLVSVSEPLHRWLSCKVIGQIKHSNKSRESFHSRFPIEECFPSGQQ